MLSVGQKHYADICAAKIADPKKTREILGAEFGCSPKTIDHAIAWGKHHDVFVLDTGIRVQHHIAGLQVTNAKLERAFGSQDRRYRKLLREGNDPGARACINVMATLSERILANSTRIMELEGLLRKTLALQHSGPGGGAVRVEYEIVKQPDGSSPA